MFMDGTTAMIIMAPILGPVAQKLGIDMVHFGVVLVVNCAIGAITPPFGVVIYLVAPMLKMRVDDFIKELIPFYCGPDWYPTDHGFKSWTVYLYPQSHLRLRTTIKEILHYEFYV